MPPKQRIDYDSIEPGWIARVRLYAAVMACIDGASEQLASLAGDEGTLVGRFIANQKHEVLLERSLPMSTSDTIVEEYPFRYGRADIVIFHVDGSGTVIEAKDGRVGYNGVARGIGQASLYAVQLGARKEIINHVRKALLFTGTGDGDCDRAIILACVAANTIPIQYPSHEEYCRESLTDAVYLTMRAFKP